jgi:hypothetical protein
MVDRFDVDVTETGPGDGRYRLGVPGHRSSVRETCGWPEPEDGSRHSWHQRLLPTEPPVADWPMGHSISRPSLLGPNSGKRSQLKVY